MTICKYCAWIAGKMVVFLGGKASGFRNLHDHDTYDVDGTRLFQVGVSGLWVLVLLNDKLERR
jgi:hypothetical protein